MEPHAGGGHEGGRRRGRGGAARKDVGDGAGTRAGAGAWRAADVGLLACAVGQRIHQCAAACIAARGVAGWLKTKHAPQEPATLDELKALLGVVASVRSEGMAMELAAADLEERYRTRLLYAVRWLAACRVTRAQLEGEGGLRGTLLQLELKLDCISSGRKQTAEATAPSDFRLGTRQPSASRRTTPTPASWRPSGARSQRRRSGATPGSRASRVASGRSPETRHVYSVEE